MKLLTITKVIMICLIINQITVVAQDLHPKQAQNQVYLELGGLGLIYSLNYERFLSQNFTLRAGLGVTPGLLFVDGTIFTIPISGSYLIGDGYSKLELGLGVTYLTTTDIDIFGLPAGSNSLIAFDGIIGYRGGSPNGGFIFRVAFTPMYSSDFAPNFIPYGLVSFGFGF